MSSGNLFSKNNPRCLWALGATLVGFLSMAHADEVYRPATPNELIHGEFASRPFSERAYRVPDAKVAYANYYALRRDFPALASFTERQIDQWILDNFAYIGERQLRLNGIRNSRIKIDPSNTKTAYRPHGYNRAAVLESKGPGHTSHGLIDVKGMGQGSDVAVANQKEIFRNAIRANEKTDLLNKLRVSDHSDGLMSFGEAIAETSRQTAVQRLFDIHNARFGTNFQTVESYFIVQMPFNILKNDGTSIPAALYGRQPHWGRADGARIPPGIYTDYHGNTQTTYLGTSVDFGGVIVNDNRLSDRFGVPPGGDPQNAQMSRAWAKGHEVAEQFVKGDENAVKRHLEYMLEPIETDWRQSMARLSKQARPRPQTGLNGLLDALNNSPSPPSVRSLSEVVLGSIPSTTDEALRVIQGLLNGDRLPISEYEGHARAVLKDSGITTDPGQLLRVYPEGRLRAPDAMAPRNANKTIEAAAAAFSKHRGSDYSVLNEFVEQNAEAIRRSPTFKARVSAIPNESLSHLSLLMKHDLVPGVKSKVFQIFDVANPDHQMNLIYLLGSDANYPKGVNPWDHSQCQFFARAVENKQLDANVRRALYQTLADATQLPEDIPALTSAILRDLSTIESGVPKLVSLRKIPWFKEDIDAHILAYLDAEDRIRDHAMAYLESRGFSGISTRHNETVKELQKIMHALPEGNWRRRRIEGILDNIQKELASRSAMKPMPFGAQCIPLLTTILKK